MSRLFWTSILTLAFAGFASAEPTIPKFVTTYQTDSTLCAKMRSLKTSFRGCEIPDERCFEPEVSTQSISVVPTEQIAVNQYGYTTVFVARPPGKPYTVVFLNGFNGDRSPRLIESWKVNAEQLSEVTNLDPKPLTYESWVKGGHGIKRETLADEFQALLSHGERLSEDSSPVWMPIFRIDDTDYFLTRECAGTWAYGGYYYCKEVIKVKVKRIAGTKSVPVCEYSKRKGH